MDAEASFTRAPSSLTWKVGPSLMTNEFQAGMFIGVGVGVGECGLSRGLGIVGILNPSACMHACMQ